MLNEYLRFNLHGIFSVISGLLCLILGTLVLLKDRRSKTHQAFFLFSLSTSIWIVSYGFMSLVRDIYDASLFDKTAYIYGIPFISVNSYLFSLRLRGNTRHRLSVVIGNGWAAVLAVWFITRYEKVSIVKDFSWGRYSVWPPNFESMVQSWLLTIPFFFYSFACIFQLYRAYKDSASLTQRIRSRNCLIAFLIVYTALVDFFAANGFPVYPFGYISLTGLTIIVAYTIVRHQFLDIRIVLKRLSLILVIYFGLFILLLPLAIPLLKQLTKDPGHNPVSVTLTMGVAIGLVFSMGPLIYAYFVRHSFWLRANVTTGLTHELKSPLSAIAGAVEIVRTQISAKKPDRVELSQYLDMVDRNVSRMENYVKDLLNLAKIQEESISLDRAETDLSKIVSDTIEVMRPLAEHKGLKIASDVQEGIVFSADHPKIQQVISSLLSNAIKFSDNGSIQVTLAKDSTQIILTVRDEGRGIEPKHMDKIFDRFYQINPSTKGSGIGLTIARAWIEAHQGTISVESKGSGCGSKFVVTFLC